MDEQDRDEILEHMVDACGRRPGVKDIAAKTADMYLKLAAEPFPRADKIKAAADAYLDELRMLPDSMLLPTGTTLGQLREMVECTKEWSGPSSKVDIAKALDPELAVGLARQTSVKPKRAFNRLVGLFYALKNGGDQLPLEHQKKRVRKSWAKFW